MIPNSIATATITRYAVVRFQNYLTTEWYILICNLHHPTKKHMNKRTDHIN